MLEPHPPVCLLEHPPSWTSEATATEAVDAAAQLQLTWLRAGMDALDVGGGGGAVTRVMSSIVGPGRVIGVAPDRVTAVRAQVAFRGLAIAFLADAAIVLPLQVASLDYT